jgi:hypothetical protein
MAARSNATAYHEWQLCCTGSLGPGGGGGFWAARRHEPTADEIAGGQRFPGGNGPRRRDHNSHRSGGDSTVRMRRWLLSHRCEITVGEDTYTAFPPWNQSHVGCCPLVSPSTIVFACSMLKPYSFRAM